MPITVQCPNPACGGTSTIADTISGRRVLCNKCGQPFVANPTRVGERSDTKNSQPASPSNPFPTLPAEFGRYRVLRLLGQGGMGAVYLAEDSQLGRQVALKIPFFNASDSSAQVERFIREARSAAILHHPNICTVFDAGQIEGKPFITMAYIAGTPLEQQIDPDASMPQHRAAEIARKIAIALHNAHSNGTMHRDLKPANVMIATDGEPVVMDFGLAKRIAEAGLNEVRLTRDGGILGTPSYMSPEQVRGDNQAIGPATDIYSLGVILFEMLTGRTPYSGGLGMVMGQILGAPIPPVREFRPDVDPRLDFICQKAMAKDPNARFGSMSEFAKALNEYLSAPASSPPTFPNGANRPLTLLQAHQPKIQSDKTGRRSVTPSPRMAIAPPAAQSLGRVRILQLAQAGAIIFVCIIVIYIVLLYRPFLAPRVGDVASSGSTPNANEPERRVTDGAPVNAEPNNSGPWSVGKQENVDVKPVPHSQPKTTPIIPNAPLPNLKPPGVVGIESSQIDVVRGPMQGYDIIYDMNGNARIAVRSSKVATPQNKENMTDAVRNLVKRGKMGAENYKRYQEQQSELMRFVGAQPDVPPRPGGFPGPVASRGHGVGGAIGSGSVFDNSATRSDVRITYIPIEDFEKAIAAGNVPAMTVVPLRMAVVNATIPLKKQMEEVLKALSLKDPAQAYAKVQFDGFEVRRRISNASGKILEAAPEHNLASVRENPEFNATIGWIDYHYEQKYIELIDAKKLADHFEGSAPGDRLSPYLPYFCRYEENLVMPLPELIPELASYPQIKLPSITAAIDKMISVDTRKVDAAALAQRLAKKGTGKDLFKPKTLEQTSATLFFGRTGFSSTPGGPASDLGIPKGAAGGDIPNAPEPEIEDLLLRFIDCDVMPGYTYEYQFRLRMKNPISPNPGEVNQEGPKVLLGQWVPIREPITVPTEAVMYAYDPESYRKEIEQNFKGQLLFSLLQAKDDQAVVEMLAWLCQVRTDASGQREPVGAWVAARVPVSRGGYIGKKTYVELPLWSSESNQYVLRGLPASAIKKKADTRQPSGWLVDFSSRSVLVDFEGGKVRTKRRAGGTMEEDVPAELLILQPDGTLTVRSSLVDERNEDRLTLKGRWLRWVREVGSRPAKAGADPTNPFGPKQ